jgi:hypothetical protein
VTACDVLDLVAHVCAVVALVLTPIILIRVAVASWRRLAQLPRPRGCRRARPIPSAPRR